MSPASGLFAHVHLPSRAYMGGGLALLVLAGAASTVTLKAKYAPLDFLHDSITSLLQRCGLARISGMNSCDCDELAKTLDSSKQKVLDLQEKLGNAEQDASSVASRAQDLEHDIKVQSNTLSAVKKCYTAEVDTIMTFAKRLYNDKTNCEARIASLLARIDEENTKHRSEFKGLEEHLAEVLQQLIASRDENSKLQHWLVQEEQKSLTVAQSLADCRKECQNNLEAANNVLRQKDTVTQKLEVADAALTKSLAACGAKDEVIIKIRQREAVAVEELSHKDLEQIVCKQEAEDAISAISTDFAQYKQEAEHEQATFSHFKQQVEHERKTFKEMNDELQAIEMDNEQLRSETTLQAAALTDQQELSAKMKTKERATERKLASTKKKLAATEDELVLVQQAAATRTAELEKENSSNREVLTKIQQEVQDTRVALNVVAEQRKTLRAQCDSAAASQKVMSKELESKCKEIERTQKELNATRQARDAAISQSKMAKKLEEESKTKMAALEEKVKQSTQLQKTFEKQLNDHRIKADQIKSLEQNLRDAQKKTADAEESRISLEMDLEWYERELSNKDKKIKTVSEKLSKFQESSKANEEALQRLTDERSALKKELHDFLANREESDTKHMSDMKLVYFGLCEELYTTVEAENPSNSHRRAFSTQLYDDTDLMSLGSTSTMASFKRTQAINSRAGSVDETESMTSKLDANAPMFECPERIQPAPAPVPFHHQLPPYLAFGSFEAYSAQPEFDTSIPHISKSLVTSSQSSALFVDPAILSRGPCVEVAPVFQEHYPTSSGETGKVSVELGSEGFSLRPQVSTGNIVPEVPNAEAGLLEMKNEAKGNGLQASKYANAQTERLGTTAVDKSNKKHGTARGKRAGKRAGKSTNGRKGRPWGKGN